MSAEPTPSPTPATPAPASPALPAAAQGGADGPASWQPPVLRLNGVAKGWEPGAGLDPVSLTIAPGEIVAVQGPPGSGKSTLVALLAGWCLPDEGEIVRQGDWAAAGAWSTWRHTTVVPQRPSFLPELGIADHLDAVLAWLGVATSHRRPFALHLLDRVGLVGVASRPAGDVSPAHLQRLAVARAIAGTVVGAIPTLVVADEPTSRQPEDRSPLVVEALRAAAVAGAAVVVTTDDPAVLALGRTVTLP